jgi:hypothetical protein
MLRKIGGVLLGLVVAWLLVMLAEALVHKFYPPPAGINMNDFNEVKKFVASLPVSALLLVLSGWLMGTLAGTFAAARVGRSATPAYVLGAILLAAGIANAIIIPQPVWFSAVSFVIYITMSLTGARLGFPSLETPRKGMPALDPPLSATVNDDRADRF